MFGGFTSFKGDAGFLGYTRVIGLVFPALPVVYTLYFRLHILINVSVESGVLEMAYGNRVKIIAAYVAALVLLAGGVISVWFSKFPLFIVTVPFALICVSHASSICAWANNNKELFLYENYKYRSK